MEAGRAAIVGSAPVHPPSVRRLKDLNADTPLSASIILQRQTPSSGLEQRLFSPDFQPISRNEAARQLGADPGEISAVEEFCKTYGLQVSSTDIAGRTLKVQGSAAQMEAAFGVHLGLYQGENGQNFISYDGEISMPKNLAASIMAVTGLDNRPVARARQA